MTHSLAESSYQTYQRAWQSLQAFRSGKGSASNSHIVTTEELISFTANLHAKGYSSATVHTYVSAVNHIHRTAGGGNLMDNFIIKKLLDSTAKLDYKRARRSHIDVPLLEQLVGKIPAVLSSQYEICLFKTTFLLLFYLAARIGELAT